MPLRAFRVAYDGTGYHGFQRQPDVPTVEDTIFDALRALEVLALTPTNPRATPLPAGPTRASPRSPRRSHSRPRTGSHRGR